VAYTDEPARLLELFELQEREGPARTASAPERSLPTSIVPARGSGGRCSPKRPGIPGSRSPTPYRYTSGLHQRASRGQAVLCEHLQTALHSRVIIEQDKGVLSARAGTNVAEAFRRMRTHAQMTGQPLTTVADAIIAGSLRGGNLRETGGSLADGTSVGRPRPPN
jgi:hypothetical protein